MAVDVCVGVEVGVWVAVGVAVRVGVGVSVAVGVPGRKVGVCDGVEEAVAVNPVGERVTMVIVSVGSLWRPSGARRKSAIPVQ